MAEIQKLGTWDCYQSDGVTIDPTKINLPAIGCVPKNYLIYGGIGVVLLYILSK